MASFKKILYGIIYAGAEETLEARNERLRKHAASYGWPSEIVNKLTHSKDGVASYPKDIENAVLTLEYGTQDVPPAPALRTFMLGAK